MNGDYGAHRVLISSHRPLVWVRQSPLAMGGGGNVQYSVRAKPAGGNKAESF